MPRYKQKHYTWLLVYFRHWVLRLELKLSFTRWQCKYICLCIYLSNVRKIVRHAINNGYEVTEMHNWIFSGHLNVMKNSSRMGFCHVIFFLMEIRNKALTHIVVLTDDILWSTSKMQQNKRIHTNKLKTCQHTSFRKLPFNCCIYAKYDVMRIYVQINADCH
jgi:hypothetical protein